jgi:hypothetical protein
MIDVDDKLMDSWQDLLDGFISVPFYKQGGVPEDETGNYVECYVEGSSGYDTKHNFGNEVVLITNIVTRFDIAIDTSVANGIDNEIKTLVKPSSYHSLPSQSGIQILDVRFSSGQGLEQYSSGKKYYRKVVRYTHRIIQTG